MSPDLSTTGKYLKSEMVKDGDLIKFKDAGVTGEKDNPFKPGEKKPFFEITVELSDGQTKTCGVNFTSQKELVKVLGKNTEDWVGKVAKIQKIKQNVGGKIKDVVYIVPVDTTIDLEKE